MSEFLEFPEQKLMLVRLSDERQIIVSQSVAPQIVSATPLQATRRKRSDYWHLPDLQEFNRDWQQRLDPNNPQSLLEYSWLGFDPVTGSNWRRFHNRIRLVEVGGEHFHLSESIAVPDPVSKPAGVR